MDRSQLRRLAEERAKGQVGEDAYRKQRAKLIDDIVSGRIPIEREPPPPPPQPGSYKKPPPAPPPQPRLGIPVAVYIGGGIVVIAAAIWAFIFANSPGPGSRAAVESPAPATSIHKPPAAKALIEDFLSNVDWGEASLARFEARWSDLSQTERAQARIAPWFRRLSTALRQEINAQRALAELDATGAAARASARLEAFSRLLTLKETESTIPPSTPNRGDVSLQIEGPESERPQSGGTAPPALPASERKSSHGLPGNRWVEAVGPAKFTLQLFAENGLQKIEGLISAYPELQLKVLSLEAQTPRYRVLYGIFESAREAEEAIGSLPVGIRKEAHKPRVKSIQELRDEALSRLTVKPGVT